MTQRPNPASLPISAKLIKDNQSILFDFLFFGTLSLALLLYPSIGITADASIALIHSTDEPNQWTRTVKEGVAAAMGPSTHIHEIWPGTSDDDDEHFETRHDELLNTWRDREVDGVIVDGELAFAFIRKYGETLFNSAPVVICTMERIEPDYLSQCGQCTAVPMGNGIDKLPELIFTLKPQTSLVVGIMDDSAETRVLQQRLEQAMEPYFDKATTLYPGHEPGDNAGLNMELLGAVASSTPRNGAIVLLGFNDDNESASVRQTDVVKLLVRLSEAPVYVLYDNLLDTGALGGIVAQGKDQGYAAGHALARIFQGDTPQEMLNETVEPRPVIDTTAAMRLGLGTAAQDGTVHIPNISDNAILTNRPQLPISEMGATPSGFIWYMAGGITFFAFVLVIMTRRSRAQKDR